MASATKKPIVRVPVKRSADGDSDHEQEERKPVTAIKAKASVEQKVPLDNGKKAESKKVENVETKKSTGEKKAESAKKSAKPSKSDDEEDDDVDVEVTKKKTKKQEDPVETRKRFMNTFPEIHANARSKLSFVAVGKPKSFLQIGGMGSQLKKHPEMVYSLVLNVAGTHEDIDEMLAHPVVHDYLVREGLIGDDGDEDAIRSTLITADNYEKRKDDKDFKDFENAKNNTREALKNLLDQILATSNDKPVKMSQQERIVKTFDLYRSSNKVYDVSHWNSETNTGFKTVARPSSRTKKIIATTLPIISNDPQKITSFTLYLGYDVETARREAGLDSKGRTNRD